MRTLITVLLFVLCAPVVYAQGDDLMELKVQASNLDAHRDELERKLAAEQVRSYRLANEVEKLKKQLAEAQKPTPKTPE